MKYLKEYWWFVLAFIICLCLGLYVKYAYANQVSYRSVDGVVNCIYTSTGGEMLLGVITDGGYVFTTMLNDVKMSVGDVVTITYTIYDDGNNSWVDDVGQITINGSNHVVTVYE